MPLTAPLAGLPSAWSKPWIPLDPARLAAWWWSQPGEVVWLDSSSSGHHLIGTGATVVTSQQIDQVEQTLRTDPGPWVGWFGFEAGAERIIGALKRDPSTAAASVSFVKLDRWVVIAPDGSTTLHARTADLAFAVEELPALAAQPDASTHDSLVATVARDTDQEYRTKIERCLDHLRAGDAWVLCLTTALTSPPIDALASHLRLRELSPVPRGGLLRIGEVCLSSASMEQFLSVAQRHVTTSPIKGTRPRSADPATDQAQIDDLRHSDKERAENIMIVDLCRNDLGRICRPGSVQVPELLHIKSYATVHQLVSTVTGELNDGLGPLDAVAALFPAGSMTGAPKKRSLEILTGLEGAARGIYSGCFGLISGDLADLSMVIRSVVSTPEGAHLGVGGGITVLSEPDDEVAEIHLKAEALQQSLRPYH